jgi:hypothetical protein
MSPKSLPASLPWASSPSSRASSRASAASSASLHRDRALAVDISIETAIAFRDPGGDWMVSFQRSKYIKL